jgi:Ca-activated chloride channel family protein
MLVLVALLFATLIGEAIATPDGRTPAVVGFYLSAADAGGEPVAAVAQDTDVSVTITGLIARTVMRQTYRNPGKHWAEGVYVFPLPESGAVDHMRLLIDDQVIEGEVMEKEEAKQAYETAKAQGQQASLTTQNRPNIFTTSVANIPPGGKIVVEIEFQQPVRLDDGVFTFAVPLVVGPRYIPGVPTANPATGLGWSPDTDQVPDASQITPPVVTDNEGPVNPVRLTVDLSAGFAIDRIESPTHDIVTKRVTNDPARATITLAGGREYADRDFYLRFTAVEGKEPGAIFYTEQGSDGAYYSLVTVTPPTSGEGSTVAPSREVIFVVDRSGSMAGTSMPQAKEALRYALSRLDAKDRFNIIGFDHRYITLFDTPQSATIATVDQGLAFVDTLEPDGGTEALPALVVALSTPAPEKGMVGQVVFITDGDVGNEEAIFSAVEKHLGSRRLFTVAIGTAPNGHLLTRVSQFGRGAFVSITRLSEAQTMMSYLFRILNDVALTDLTVTTPGVVATEIYPNPLPDLYHGEPLFVVMKSEKKPSSVKVEWHRGGKTESTTVKSTGATDNRGIGVSWARAKIANLMDDHRRAGGDADKSAPIRAEVVKTALTHHLASQFTSLVAVDKTPVRPMNEQLDTTAIKTNLPKGWVRAKVFGMPQTATGAERSLIFGIGFLMVAFALGFALRNSGGEER